MARLGSYCGVVVVAVALLACLVDINAHSRSECEAQRNALLGHWSFDGTYDDVSSNQRGPAIGAWDRPPVGGNINLQWLNEYPCTGYVHVGNPGYLEVPRVDIHNISFTFSFSVKLNGQMSLRRILYADWNTDNWTFMTFITPDRKVTVWVRNTAQAGLVSLTSSVAVPLSKWTDIAFNWDRTSRTASIYVNSAKVGTQTVASNIKDINLFKSNTYYYQFGAKADSTSVATDYAPLDADVRNLRVFKGFVLAASAAQPSVIVQ